MLVTVNDKLKFEIEIVHDLSCHPILSEIMYINMSTSITHVSLPYYIRQLFTQPIHTLITYLDINILEENDKA